MLQYIYLKIKYFFVTGAWLFLFDLFANIVVAAMNIFDLFFNPATSSSEIEPCEECNGTGYIGDECELCGHEGWVEDPDGGDTMTCPECSGDAATRCYECDGTGEC